MADPLPEAFLRSAIERFERGLRVPKSFIESPTLQSGAWSHSIDSRD